MSKASSKIFKSLKPSSSVSKAYSNQHKNLKASVKPIKTAWYIVCISIYLNDSFLCTIFEVKG